MQDTCSNYMPSNKKMIKLLKRMFNEHPVCLFAKLTNKKIIASMNSFQLTYIDTGSIYYNSIENGIFSTDHKDRDYTVYYQFCTALPVGTMIAQTFNE